MDFGLFKIELIPLLLGIGAIIVIFLIIRALVLWYWKIDYIVYLLEQIERNTRKKEDRPEEIEKNKRQP